MATILSILLAVAASSELPAHERLALVVEGLKAFDEGTQLSLQNPAGAAERYRQAADVWTRVVDSGVVNGKLYYNLGNAHLRLGRIGKAIIAYRRAQRLNPTDGRVVANLRSARNLSATHIEASAESVLIRKLFFWHFDTSIKGRAVAAEVFIGAAWLALIVGLFVRRRWLGSLGGTAMVLGVVLIVSVAVQWRAETSSPEGVLIANEVVVRKGNDESYQPQFNEPLSQGVEFRVLESRSEWYRIRLANGKEGWIRAHQAELI